VVTAATSVAGVLVGPIGQVQAEGVIEIQPCSAQPPLAKGSTGPGVRCLQFSLIMLGFDVPYDGDYDDSTVDAVRWYESTHALGPDGKADDLLLASLGIGGHAAVFVPAGSLGPPTTVASKNPPSGGVPGQVPCVADAELIPGERGQSVTCLQRRLIEIGFTKVAVTGVYDTATEQAIRTYQKATPPLVVDGRSGPRTLAALDIWSGLSAGNGRNVGPGPFPAPMQNEPEWRLTAEGIPVYGNRTACTAAQAAVIAGEFANDGADAATQQWAVYVASREGGCRHEAVNLNPRTRDDSHCTFQLNAMAGMFEPHGSLGRRGWTTDLVKSSLQACADAASDLWVYCGRGPWTPPYSCTPPWAGATNGQPPALIPPPPSTVLPPETAPPTTVVESPPTTTSPTTTTTTTSTIP
jgi:peptidoglycan hydrolase-like protein with peptidoglycan-binding domain